MVVDIVKMDFLYASYADIKSSMPPIGAAASNSCRTTPAKSKPFSRIIIH
jgi:hypothetical protein